MVIAIVLRLFIFRPKKLIPGEFFIPTLAVSIALTLGGLFFLSFKQYFSMPGIYYVGALGFGMLLLNSIFETNFEKNVDLTKFLAKMMIGVGIMGIGMIVTTYIKHYQLIFTDTFLFASNFQWGNNLSNALLIAMPFAFYLAVTQKRSIPYFILGILEYLAIVMGLSRGGMLFGTIAITLSCIASIIVAKTKRNRLKFAVVTSIFLAIVAICLCTFLLPVVKDLLNNLKISNSESRVLLYALAWKNFLKHPLFGTGLAYNPHVYYFPQTMCIYWYHSTLFQVLGSLGILGIIAYSIQAFYRMRAIFKIKSLFNLFVLISIIGFAGYSMLNVGYFIPLPNMAILIVVFIVVDRNNKYLKKNPKIMEKELISLK